MKFIDKDIIKQAEEEEKISSNVATSNNNVNTNTNVNSVIGSELEFNKKNRENFENLMTESSTNLDNYFDKNNPFVKLILLVLGVIIVFGVIFYVLAYLNR